MRAIMPALLLAAMWSIASGVAITIAQEQTTISDPTEFREYRDALSQAQPAEKAAAVEDFLAKYPNTLSNPRRWISYC